MDIFANRRGSILLHTLVAMLLIASVLTAAFALGGSRIERAANRLEHRQLIMLSESVVTQALWQISHTTAPLPQTETLYTELSGPEGQVAKLYAYSERPGWMTLRAEARRGRNEITTLVECLVLTERCFFDNPDPQVIVTADPVIDVGALTLEREKDILLVGENPHAVHFTTQTTPTESAHFYRDLHVCSISEPFSYIQVSTPLVVDGLLILEGDCLLEKPLRAREIVLLGDLSIEGEGSLEAQTIFCTEIPDEEIQERCIGEFEIMAGDYELERRIFLFDLNKSRKNIL